MIYFDTFSIYPLLNFNQIQTSAAMLPAELAHRALRSEDNEERARRIGGYILLEKMMKKHADGFKSDLEGIVKPEFGMMFENRDILPCVRYDSYGKPYFEGHENAAFNLSHSAHMAACAISLSTTGGAANAVGIDVQIVSDNLDQAKRMVDGYFSDAEKAKMAYVEADAAAYCRLFTEIWTKKEALLKCLGVGLAGVSAADTEDPAALGCRFVASEERELTYTDLEGKEHTEKYCVSVCEQIENATTEIG